jgi:hypothetical protein
VITDYGRQRQLGPEGTGKEDTEGGTEIETWGDDSHDGGDFRSGDEKTKPRFRRDSGTEDYNKKAEQG